MSEELRSTRMLRPSRLQTFVVAILAAGVGAIATFAWMRSDGSAAHDAVNAGATRNAIYVRQAPDPDRAVHLKLDVLVPHVRFQRSPLREVLDQISRASGVPIRADWNDLAQEHLAPDTAIDLEAGNVTAHELLVRLMNRLDAISLAAWSSSGSGPPSYRSTNGCGFEIAGDGVRIAMVQQGRLHDIVRVYDIRDILSRAFVTSPALQQAMAITLARERARAAAAAAASEPATQPTTTPANGGSDEERWHNFEPSVNATVQPNIIRRYEGAMDIPWNPNIGAIYVDEWSAGLALADVVSRIFQVEGHGYPQITYYGGKLIVSTSPYFHARLAHLLDAMRREEAK